MKKLYTKKKDIRFLKSAKKIKKDLIGTPYYNKNLKSYIRKEENATKHRLCHKKKKSKKVYWILGI